MNNKSKNKFVIILTELFRINDVFKWSLISFTGFILGISTLSLSPNILPFAVFLIAAFCIFSFTFIINNYYDVETDKKNPRRKDINAIASGMISKKSTNIINICLILISLIVCFLFKFEVFVFCIFLIFISWSYSAPPFRIKGRPVFDVIWHFFGFIAAILMGSIIAGSITQLSIFYSISLGIFSAVGQVGNHIEDYSYDKSSNTMTFAVWVGLEKAKKAITVLTFFHLVFLIPLILLYSLSYFISILILIAIPILGFILIRPKRGVFPSKRCFIYFFTIVIGGAVYLSCLAYHILFLLGEPAIELLKIIGIN